MSETIDIQQTDFGNMPSIPVQHREESMSLLGEKSSTSDNDKQNYLGEFNFLIF